MKQKRTTPENGIYRRRLMMDLFADAKVDFIINQSGTLTMIVDDRADVDFARKDGTDSFAAVGGGTYIGEEHVSQQSTPELLTVLKQFAEDASGTRRYVNVDGSEIEKRYDHILRYWSESPWDATTPGIKLVPDGDVASV